MIKLFHTGMLKVNYLSCSSPVEHKASTSCLHLTLSLAMNCACPHEQPISSRCVVCLFSSFGVVSSVGLFGYSTLWHSHYVTKPSHSPLFYLCAYVLTFALQMQVFIADCLRSSWVEIFPVVNFSDCLSSICKLFRFSSSSPELGQISPNFIETKHLWVQVQVQAHPFQRVADNNERTKI